MKMYVSFGRLLRRVTNGEVQPVELESVLFYFGCARQAALGPLEESPYYDNIADDGERGERAFKAIQTAVRWAEAAGRVVWRRKGEFTRRWRDLNRLLRQNGYPAVRRPFWGLLGGYRWINYNREIADALRAIGAEIEVIQ